MIDVTKIIRTLESKRCETHEHVPCAFEMKHDKLKTSTCCEKFKKELEIAFKTEIINQTQDAIRKLLKRQPV